MADFRSVWWSVLKYWNNTENVVWSLNYCSYLGNRGHWMYDNVRTFSRTTEIAVSAYPHSLHSTNLSKNADKCWQIAIVSLSWKVYKIIINSAVHCLNVLKFDTLVHCGSLEATELLNPLPVKSKVGKCTCFLWTQCNIVWHLILHFLLTSSELNFMANAVTLHCVNFFQLGKPSHDTCDKLVLLWLTKKNFSWFSTFDRFRKKNQEYLSEN